jgi:hypothetical protein
MVIVLAGLTIQARCHMFSIFGQENATRYAFLSFFVPLANIILLYIVGSRQPVPDTSEECDDAPTDAEDNCGAGNDWAGDADENPIL